MVSWGERVGFTFSLTKPSDRNGGRGGRLGAAGDERALVGAARRRPNDLILLSTTSWPRLHGHQGQLLLGWLALLTPAGRMPHLLRGSRSPAVGRARQKELSHTRGGQALPPFPGPRRGNGLLPAPWHSPGPPLGTQPPAAAHSRLQDTRPPPVSTPTVLPMP